ncbi:hypothetical protein LIA77_04297 [Sarocladium implicatum]|nr:hypothetical protein LIA77_04297 [Sarocladium implicatum]
MAAQPLLHLPANASSGQSGLSPHLESRQPNSNLLGWKCSDRQHCRASSHFAICERKMVLASRSASAISRGPLSCPRRGIDATNLALASTAHRVYLCVASCCLTATSRVVFTVLSNPRSRALTPFQSFIAVPSHCRVAREPTLPHVGFWCYCTLRRSINAIGPTPFRDKACVVSLCHRIHGCRWPKQTPVNCCLWSPASALSRPYATSDVTQFNERVFT